MGWYTVKIWSVFYNWVNLTTLLFELYPPTHSKRHGKAVSLRPNSLLAQDLQQQDKVITQRHIPGIWSQLDADQHCPESQACHLRALTEIFLCSVTCFIPFYSISLCFLNPRKCLEHAIPLTTLPRKHLPLFWTWHILALLVASDICWETSWNCSPFPFELIIFTAQFSHSKDGKSSFI